MDLMDYRRKIIANSPHLAPASGAVATFSDGADLPLKSLLVDIEPVQSGTGDPSPSNVRPISGWNAVKVTRCGKNLFNPHVYTGIAYNPTVGSTVTLADSATQFTDNGNGVFTVTTSSTWRYFNVIIPIDVTRNYATKIAFSSTGQAGVTRGYLDADFKILTKFNSTDTAISWEYSLIPETNAAYYYFVFTNRGTASATLTLTQPQFVEGTTVGAYEPYNGVNVSIDLGQTVYGGTLNVLTGVLTVDRAIVDLGTLNWTRTNTKSPHWRFGTIPSGMLQDSTLVSTQYVQITPSVQWLGSIGVATQLITGVPAIMVSDERYETAADFKTAMSGVQLVYELATPYETQLTPHQIRSLYGNNTIFADTGNTALEYWAHP